MEKHQKGRTKMTPQILSNVFYAIASCLFIFAMWTLIRLHWRIGKPWTTHRANAEKLRVEIAKIEQKENYSPEELESTIKNFNALAKSLRLPAYKEEPK